jgi:hypothetical protein
MAPKSVCVSSFEAGPRSWDAGGPSFGLDSGGRACPGEEVASERAGTRRHDKEYDLNWDLNIVGTHGMLGPRRSSGESSCGEAAALNVIAARVCNEGSQLLAVMGEDEKRRHRSGRSGQLAAKPGRQACCYIN